MWHELAELHDIRFRDPWKLTPPTHLYYTGIFKGGGKNPLVYKSYRKIGLLPYPTKVDQGCVAYRESVCTDIDEAQSVANHGVDCRHQIHLIKDLVVYKRCMITVDVDIATCFPSYEQNDGSLTKFDEGVPVHLIEAIASLNHDAKASIKVGPCRYTEPMRMSVGTVEGGVDS